MKKLHALIAVVAFLAFAGCASLKTPEGQAKLANRAYGAAYAGTVTTLEFLPQKRSGFEQAVADLKFIESGSITPSRLIEVINRLDVRELKSREARIAITAGRIIITTEIGDVPIDQIERLRPVAVKIREGIEQGLKDSK